MKKNLQVLYISLVLLLLLGAAGITLFGQHEQASVYENRKLEPMPELTLSSASDGSFFSKTERYLADRMAGRLGFQKLAARLDILLGRPVVNDIVLTEDALLPCFYYDALGSIDSQAADNQRRAEAAKEKAEPAAANITEIAALAKRHQARFIYMAVPAQYTVYADSYPDYMDSRAERYEAERDALFEAIRASNAKEPEDGFMTIIDLGECLDADDYSAVDHHYKISGAYKALKLLEDFFRAKVSLEAGADPGIACDAMQPVPEFELRSAPNPYLGSRSRKIFGLSKFSEHLEYMLPQKEIPFIRTENGVKSDSPIISLPENPEDWISYTAFMGGDCAKTCIDTGRPGLPTVLIYGDSFTNALETLLYTMCDKMYAVDLRHCTESLGDIIEETHPDIIICLRDYSVLLDTSGNGQGAK